MIRKVLLNENFKLNYVTHNVKFSDGQVKEYVASAIEENMVTRVDSERLYLVLTHSNNYWKKDETTIDLVHIFFVATISQKRFRKTTREWKL